LLLIKSVSITPNPCYTGQLLSLQVEVIDLTWQNFKTSNTSWATVRLGYLDWNSVKYESK